MVFLFVSWVISSSKHIQRHEELERKIISYYRATPHLKSFKYFSHWMGQDMSAVGGRLEIFEFEDLGALEKFFEELWSNKDAADVLMEKLELINPETVRFYLLTGRDRNLWFEKE